MGILRRKKKKKLEDYSPEEIEEMQKKSMEAFQMIAGLQKQQEVRVIKSDIDKCLECGSTSLYKEAGAIVCEDCNRVYRIEK